MAARQCGADVHRCAGCDNTVADNHVRAGKCPRCGGTDIVPGTCRVKVAEGKIRCRRHGANAPQAVAAARRRVLAVEAGAELARLGVAIETTPVEALEAMLYEAAGNVAVLRQLVADLDLEVSGFTFDVDGGHVLAPEGDGIAVRSYHESGAHTGKAEPHVLVVMYNAERDRLAKLAEACAKLGLDERRVRLAEAQVEKFFAAVGRAIAAAEMTAVQATSFKRALAGELRADAA